MAYIPLNLKTVGPDGLMVNSIALQPDAIRMWHYTSTDTMTTVRAANYFSDAKQRGMKVGDMVTVLQTTGGAVTAVTLAVVMAVASTGADLSDGTTISVTNS